MFKTLVLLLLTSVIENDASPDDNYDLSQILARLEQQDRMLKLQQDQIAQLETKLSKCSCSRLDGSQGAAEKMGSINNGTFPRSLDHEDPVLENPESDLSQRCAFSATPTTDINTQADVTLVFATTFINENNCYNTGDGIFVANLDGLYYFYWKITAHSGKYAGVVFNVNGKRLAPLLQVRSEGLHHNSVSDFAVVRMRRGDHAYLTCDMSSSFIHNTHSGFGGFFVSE